MTTGIDKMEERKIERYCKERASERTSNRRKKKNKKGIIVMVYTHVENLVVATTNAPPRGAICIPPTP